MLVSPEWRGRRPQTEPVLDFKEQVRVGSAGGEPSHYRVISWGGNSLCLEREGRWRPRITTSADGEVDTSGVLMCTTGRSIKTYDGLSLAVGGD